jgi:hypothetical protein
VKFRNLFYFIYHILFANAVSLECYDADVSIMEGGFTMFPPISQPAGCKNIKNLAGYLPLPG